MREYRITAGGRRQLEAEVAEYRRTARAIGLVLDEAWATAVAPAGAADAKSTSVDAIFSVVGRDYARTIGLRMIGRDFNAGELLPGPS